MAHQTGITASDELNKLIGDALKGILRLLQVHIDQDTEKLIPGDFKQPSGTWEDDFDTLVQPVLEDQRPCYIFYRLDERNSYDNHLWIFLAYTPEDAPVREKMLYAATKATLKKAFASAVLIDDVAATSKNELTLDGYRKHVETANAAPPLTRDEQELKLLHEAEDHVDIGTTTRQSHLHGVAFPIQPEALQALSNLKTHKTQYVQLSIDINSEEVLLQQSLERVGPNDLSAHISDTNPRYHFYLYKHTHEGDYMESVVFIYSCPGYKSSVRERMMYSSCKQPLIDSVESRIALKVFKKIEVDSPDEVNEGFLMNELYPKTQAFRPKFDKPKPPVRRGNNRKK